MRIVPNTLSALHYRQDLQRIRAEGMGRGESTGWRALDNLWSVAPGQLTVVTGWPNSGKSQFLDALCLNLARKGWRITFCSLENVPVYLHVEKLAKQVAGMPVRPGFRQNVTSEDLTDILDELDGWFSFVQPEPDNFPSLAEVLDSFERTWLMREWNGPRAVVIDPWNELEHARPQGLSLTEYVGEALSRLRQWCRTHMVHVFLVGHPAKQQRNNGKLPIAAPDMISDSAHFWNKADNCLCVALTGDESDLVDIHVHKVRFAHIGQRGTAQLKYDKYTGRYSDAERIVDANERRYAD